MDLIGFGKQAEVSRKILINLSTTKCMIRHHIFGRQEMIHSTPLLWQNSYEIIFRLSQ